MFDYLGLQSFELAPVGHRGVAVYVQGNSVAFGRIHGYEHILRLGIHFRMMNQIAAGIGAEKSEVRVDCSVDSVSVAVLLSVDFLTRCGRLACCLLVDDKLVEQRKSRAQRSNLLLRGEDHARAVDENIVVYHPESDFKHIAPVLKRGADQRIGWQHHHGIVEVLYFHYRERDVHHDAVGIGGRNRNPVAHAEHVVLG